MTIDELLSGLGVGPAEVREVGPVRAFQAESADLVPLWHRLRAAHDQSGLWPLLLGPDLDGFAESHADHAGEVERGLAFDVDAKVAELKAEALADVDEDEDIDLPPRGDVDDLDEHDDDGFYLAEKRGWIGLIEAPAGYVVPGLLGWSGAVNYDIDPSVHVAMLKHWNDRFGADLVGLSFDVIELWVPRPPTEPAEVMSVAEQQYWYCSDVVDQGVGTLDALAIVQVPTNRWFFWWD